ncbi:MAG: response regulator [Desulfobacterales bacterium]|nr:response regulator [Desulfobacterales bacterium]
MNILVVDDEKVQLETLKRGLRSKGHEVAGALSAKDAIRHLEDSTLRHLKNGAKIDLVLTDYSMPEMNGLELLKRIRKDHGSLPVIMMTAYGEKDLIIDALRNRCDSFIEKPFTLDQLMQEIERAKISILENANTDQLSDLIPEFLHQINNPLTSIIGSAELAMLKSNNAEAIKKLLTGIMTATEEIQAISKELLTLGQTTKDEIEKVDIMVLLDDCIDMFKDLLLLKGITVEKDFSGRDVCLSGNKFGLEQAFKNLILNAIDSMEDTPEKILKIKVTADEKTSSVSIHVEDTGCGIPKELVDKIFTPYFTKKKDGTGLGLPVVKRVVAEHKGVIRVHSQVGKGTIFRVRFPENCGS